MNFLKRCQLIAVGLLCAAAIGILIWAGAVEPNLLSVKRIEYSLPVTQRVRVAFFSDTHFGKWYSEENLSRIAEKINEQNPDLVLFGGDFFDIYRRDCGQLSLDGIADALQSVKAPLGKYAVWGNHDYGGGAQKIYPSVMERGGFEILKNEGVTFPEQNLILYGLDDLIFGNPQKETPDSSGSSGARLLFCHEPDTADILPVDRADLILSGHSHGGQIFLPFFTQKILPPGAKNYRKGLYPREGGSVFVSSGIGMTKLPFRLFNLPEIVVIDLIPSF